MTGCRLSSYIDTYLFMSTSAFNNASTNDFFKRITLIRYTYLQMQ